MNGKWASHRRRVPASVLVSLERRRLRHRVRRLTTQESTYLQIVNLTFVGIQPGQRRTLARVGKHRAAWEILQIPTEEETC